MTEYVLVYWEVQRQGWYENVPCADDYIEQYVLHTVQTSPLIITGVRSGDKAGLEG